MDMPPSVALLGLVLQAAAFSESAARLLRIGWQFRSAVVLPHGPAYLSLLGRNMVTLKEAGRGPSMRASEELLLHVDKPIPRGRENHILWELGGSYGEEGGGESTWMNDLRAQGWYMGEVGVLDPTGRTRGCGQG